MPPDQQLALAKARIDSAEATGRNAASNFNRVQEKVFDDIAKSFQQLSLVAAGTISLSVTFLGYVISKTGASTILAQHMISIPILWVLFLSWGCLLVTMVLGLMYGLTHAWYWYALTGHDWAKNGIEVWDAHIAHDALGGVTIRPETAAPITRAEMDQTRQAWIETTGVFASHKGRHEFLLRWSRRIAVATFVIGLAFLLVFVVVVVHNLASV